MEIQIFTEPPSEPLGRSVYLTNDEWLVLSQTLESFSTTYRNNQSILIATLVTRGQVEEAVAEGRKMNDMLHRLDMLHAKIV